MNIEEKTVTELKALAYDVLASVQRLQQDLIMINQEISKRQQEPEKKEETAA